MMKLLNSCLFRLYSNAVCKIACLAAIFMGIFSPVFGHRLLVVMAAPESVYSLDYGFFTFINVMAFVVAAFCSFFIGIDYNDGTIRNKIVSGHSRMGIYIANLTVNVVAACVLCTGYLFLAFCVGRPLLGTFHHFSKTQIAGLILSAYLVLIAVAGLVTLIGMAVSNMVVSLGISVCAVIASLCFGVHQLNMQTDAVFWLGESKRGMALFWMDFLPSGQIMQFFALRVRANIGNLNPMVMIAGSLAFVVVSTVVGMMLFAKRDLK